MVMKPSPTLEDLVGIGHSKLGFYQELQQKVKLLKASNQELEKKRNEIQALLDGVSDLMIVLSEDLRIQRVNHVFRQWFPKTDPVGLHCYQLFRGQNDPCEDCPAQRALDREEIVKDLRAYKIDDELRHFDIVASPLAAGPKGERTVLVFKRDVTLENELQAKFYQAEKMATIGALAAGVAHEINNPLTAISGFAEGIQRRIKYIEHAADQAILEDFREYTRTIIDECLRCRDIVKSLLTFSRPTASSLALVSINQCVDNTLFILKHHFKERHGITVHTDLSSELPLVMGNESQLKQVIINLLTNAFDATEDGGEISVVTRADGIDHVKLIVRDTGCGIPDHLQDKLFEPFFTTKPVGKGIGIGLSTCYSIVNNHRGEIAVTSDQGQGTSFTVTLPGAET